MATNEELTLQVQQGDNAAIEALWEAVKKLCYQRSFVWFNHYRERCTAAGVTLDDLQQESFFAVLTAAKAFDPDKGFKFTTYLRYHFKNRFEYLVGIKGNIAPRPLNGANSLDKLLDDSDEGGGTRGDMIPDPAAEAALQEAEDAQFEQQLAAAVRQALASLPDREREAVTLHHLQGLTYKGAGDALGVPAERIRQLCAKGLRLLRYPQCSRLLLPFVDYGQSYGGTGFQAWKHSGSVEERLVERMGSNCPRS